MRESQSRKAPEANRERPRRRMSEVGQPRSARCQRSVGVPADGEFFMFECKRPGYSLDPHQERFRTRMDELGFTVYKCDSIEFIDSSSATDTESETARLFKPLRCQTHLIQHASHNERCAIWAGMGVGKTVTTLTFLDNLWDVGEHSKTLVLAPKRVAKNVWPYEAREVEAPEQHRSECQSSARRSNDALHCVLMPTCSP